jgi:hypothetical protein
VGVTAELGGMATAVGAAIANSGERTEQNLHYAVVVSQPGN